MNDGLQNEINIVEAYNGKHIEELTKNQKEIVEVIGDFDDDALIKAKKLKGHLNLILSLKLKIQQV